MNNAHDVLLTVCFILYTLKSSIVHFLFYEKEQINVKFATVINLSNFFTGK